MTVLAIGLFLFLGIHSSRIFAESARTQFIKQRGENAWKGFYTVVSLLGFGLIIWGYGLARQQPVAVWAPLIATKHIAALLTLFAFILLASANGKNNLLRVKLHHPMLLGVKLWAVAHLISNGNMADILLFGTFLTWAILCFASCKKRDKRLQVQFPAAELRPTIVAVITGILGWAIIVFWLHAMLIGVRPFG
jgi:uncharacterized membrane protein